MTLSLEEIEKLEALVAKAEFGIDAEGIAKASEERRWVGILQAGTKASEELVKNADALLSMAKRSLELEEDRQSETLIGRKIKVPQYVSVLSDPISYEVRTLEKYKHCIGYFQTEDHREAGDFKPLCDPSLYERGPDSEDRYISHYGSYVSNQVQAWIDLAPESEASND